MNTNLIPLCLAILALAALPASGQDYAPASVPVSSSVSWESTVTENYGGGPEVPYDESYSMSFTSANTFAVPPYSTGTYTYSKTGANTATLTYVSNTDDGLGFTETEQGTILLTFTSATGGTFSNSGSFNYNDPPFSGDGTFTSIGTFTYSPTLIFALPPLADDFNDNSKNTAKWGPDIEYLPGGTLTESSQRLNYSSNSMEGTQARPWILNPPRYDRDWEVVVDLAGTFGSVGQDTFAQAGMGIDVSVPGNEVDFMECRLGGYDNGTSIQWDIVGFLSEGAGEVPNIPLDSGQTCLRVSFDSATKVFTSYYDPDGPQNGYTWLHMAAHGCNWHRLESMEAEDRMETAPGDSAGHNHSKFHCSATQPIEPFPPAVFTRIISGSAEPMPSLKSRWRSHPLPHWSMARRWFSSNPRQQAVRSPRLLPFATMASSHSPALP